MAHPMRGPLAVCMSLVMLGCSSPTAPSPFSDLVEAGWSFGLCSGPCRGELALDDDEVTYRMLNVTGSEVLLENRGRLTAQGGRLIAYDYGKPPPELQDLHATAFSIMDALRQCASSSEVIPDPECDPWS